MRQYTEIERLPDATLRRMLRASWPDPETRLRAKRAALGCTGPGRKTKYERS